MNFILNTPNLIRKKIQQLNFQKNVSAPKSNESPTITKMKGCNGTKKLIDIFESSPWILQNNESNWWISKDLKAEHTISNDYERKTAYNNFEKAKLQELEKYIAEYLKELERVKGIFQMIHDKLPGFVPFVLRNHHISLIGNIESIITLFNEKMLAKFKCDKLTCAKIIEMISELIDNNEFYICAEYVMIFIASKRLLDNFTLIVDQMRKNLHLDFSHLHCSNIITLFIDWIQEVCNEFLNDPRRNADEIALCMETESKLRNVIKFIEDAEKIGYIKEVCENNVEGVQKIYSILKKINYECEKMLLLIPRSENFGYNRNPIDIFQLGKFITIWNEKSMLSEVNECIYEVNFFIFEKCIIYAIVVNSKRFVYNGHFWIKDCKFETVLKNDKPVTIVILKKVGRNLMMDNPEFLKIVKKLNAEHKDDEISEIDLPHVEYSKIIKDIDKNPSRRWSLVSLNDSN